jgi:hypothetical protein
MLPVVIAIMANLIGLAAIAAAVLLKRSKGNRLIELFPRRGPATISLLVAGCLLIAGGQHRLITHIYSPATMASLSAGLLMLALGIGSLLFTPTTPDGPVNQHSRAPSSLILDTHSNPGALDRFTTLALLFLFAAYFALFIPPNLKGAREPDMVASLNIDEMTQYWSLTQMLTQGASDEKTFHNWLFYDHYYYGYPSFLGGALAVFPLDLFARFGLIDTAHVTAARMFILRQLSLFYLLLAVGTLVYMWTEFRSLIGSVFLSLFLLLIPIVFSTNIYWRPDSLAILWVILTMFAFTRDNLRFGRWFYLAAIFCGLAIGTKLIGFFFFLSVFVYLVLGAARTWQSRSVSAPANASCFQQALLSRGPVSLTVRTVRPRSWMPSSTVRYSLSNMVPSSPRS